MSRSMLFIVREERLQVEDLVSAVSQATGISYHKVHTVTLGAPARTRSHERTGAETACRSLALREGDQVRMRVGIALRPAETGVPGGDLMDAADSLLDALRRVCRRRNVVVDAIAAPGSSLAGALLHAAFALVARPGDRLLAGLARGRQAVCVPVPLMMPASDELLRSDEPFSSLTTRRLDERAMREDPPALTVDCRRFSLRIGERLIPLPGMQFFWYCYLAATPGQAFPLWQVVEHVQFDERGHAAIDDWAHHTGLAAVLSRHLERLRRLYATLFPPKRDAFGARLRSACGHPPGLPATISKIGRQLRATLGLAAEPYLVRGGRGRGGYVLTLPAEAISILWNTARHDPPWETSSPRPVAS